MRNNSPDALYCPIIASNFAMGPPPPYGIDDPAASTEGAHTTAARQPSRDRRLRCDAAFAIEIFDMRVAPDVGRWCWSRLARRRHPEVLAAFGEPRRMRTQVHAAHPSRRRAKMRGSSRMTAC